MLAPSCFVIIKQGEPPAGAMWQRSRPAPPVADERVFLVLSRPCGFIVSCYGDDAMPWRFIFDPSRLACVHMCVVGGGGGGCARLYRHRKEDLVFWNIKKNAN